MHLPPFILFVLSLYLIFGEGGDDYGWREREYRYRYTNRERVEEWVRLIKRRVSLLFCVF